jgi:hypothetical protein
MNTEATLILLQLALPLAVLLAGARRLAATVAAVFLAQCLLIWLGACISFTWQCPALCHLAARLCDLSSDDHDAAPLGLALLSLASFALLVCAWVGKAMWLWWHHRARSAVAGGGGAQRERSRGRS